MNKILPRVEDAQEFTQNGVTVIALPGCSTRFLAGIHPVYMLLVRHRKSVKRGVKKAFKIIKKGKLKPMQCPENPQLLNDLRKEFETIHILYTKEDKKSARTAATVTDAEK